MCRTSRLAIPLVAFALSLAGQTSRGTLSGIISDSSGAVIGAARIELQNVEQNLVRTGESNAAGIYRFDAIDPGNYRVTVSLQGFKTFQTAAFPIAAAQVVTQDVRLEVGDQATRIEVSADSVQLQVEAPVRGGSIGTTQITQLPFANRNPVSLAFTLPGVVNTRGAPGGTGSFSVNGTRGRSNNFLLDGSENNDISVAGQAFQVTNPDAVQEVSIQTTNFDSEFGRAGGAVVNTITKSGTNDLHGSASYLVESTRVNAITNVQALNAEVQQRGKPPAGTDNWFSGTVGGPIRKNKTFYFGSYLENRQQSTSTIALQTLTESGKRTLRGLFPQGANRNVDLYLENLGASAANSQITTAALGLGRPDLEIGTFSRAYAQTLQTKQPMVKIDHRLSDKSLLYGRLAIDRQDQPVGGSVRFAGFDTSSQARYLNALVAHTYVFSPTVTNELRLPYNRINLDFPLDTTSALGATMPDILITGGSARIGANSALPQGRIANNYSLQDTVTVVRGRHTLRTGADILQQRARQFAPFAVRGVLSYGPSPGFTSWANFVDDFGGSTGVANKDFGNPAYYPSLNRHAYFVQDRWRASDALTLTLGVRYEYFGLPMNSVRTPIWSGLFNVDPVTLDGPYNKPNSVRADKNNFAPSVGVAYSPGGGDGWLGRLMGNKKTVVRMGYQIGYDSFFNNIASNAQASSPNLVATQANSVVTTALPRGLGTFSSAVPATARPLTPRDAQTLVSEDLVNPYYQKWSFGIQRELPANMVLDVSYVGTKGTKLFINEDRNPLAPAAFRIAPANTPASVVRTNRLDDLQGDRTVRSNGGLSNYHGFQTEVKRRFTRGLMFSGAHTWSKAIDNASEIFAANVVAAGSLAAVPWAFGGQGSERALSFFHRPHRVVFSAVYDLPWMKTQSGFAGRVLGGWQVSSIYAYEQGGPYTVVNGADADGFGGGGVDRPDFNPSGRPGTRAVPNAASPTGFVNPDAANAPIAAADARYIALPACNITVNPRGCRPGNAGRNLEVSPALNNFDVNFLKTVNVNERVRFEFRTEMFNFLNRPQYGWRSASAFAPTNAAIGTVAASATASVPGRFMNFSVLEGGGRVIRFNLKLLF